MNTVKFDSKGRIKMVAHRGVSGLERENTCPAFVAAGVKSYYGIETDVHVTADGKYIIGDGYPKEGYRHLIAISLETGETKTLLKAKTVIPKNGDIRCDLHSRFVFNGKYISFDTTQNEKREIACFPTSEIRF